MKKKTMLYFLLIFSPAIIFGFYIITTLAFGSFTEYKPKAEIALKENNSVSTTNNDSIFTLLNWNIGYAGLGTNADFFLDGGKSVRSKKHDFENYLYGINNFLEKEKENDFILLQEVDIHSKRSFYTNEYDLISKKLNNHSAVFTSNFNVNYIPVPLTSTSPLGKVNSGLAIFSKYDAKENLRIQFPGEYEWPKRVFHLKRCFLLKRIALNNGKDLLIINSHNSAYDNGELKGHEMAYLKEFLIREYKNGNYIIVGADWNQCPPNYKNIFSNEKTEDFYQTNIDESFLTNEWQWVYDPKIATNRKLTTKYKKETTFTTIIDYYLVSPNIQILDIETIDLDFAFSDHQPVKLKVQLK